MRYRRRPASALFSGWNWVATILSRATAQQKALTMLNVSVSRQAALLSYLDCFFVVGLFFIACIPLLLLFGKSKKALDGAPVHTSMVAE